MSNLSSRLAAVAVAAFAVIGSASTFAAEPGTYTIANGVEKALPQSERSRDAVKSETRNIVASGALKRVGEFAQAPVVDAVPAQAVATTRAQVKSELALARASHQLPRIGEL
jgi:hypothetical protein